MHVYISGCIYAGFLYIYIYIHIHIYIHVHICIYVYILCTTLTACAIVSYNTIPYHMVSIFIIQHYTVIHDMKFYTILYYSKIDCILPHYIMQSYTIITLI